MRAYTPGGRFDSDFETNEILVGVDTDLKNPVGTFAEWWVWDPIASQVDPIYDVGSLAVGRRWTGPKRLPVVRAVITQGQVPNSELGYYNADTLHLTLNAEDVERIAPGVITNPDYQNRGRIVWKGQVYRPVVVQQRGIISERFTLIVVDCIQVSPEEMVNDTQFSAYANY